MNASAKQIAHFAEVYGVSTRTIRRWLKAGIEVRNPNAVAVHLLENDSATLMAIEKTIHALLTQQSNERPTT